MNRRVGDKATHRRIPPLISEADVGTRPELTLLGMEAMTQIIRFSVSRSLAVCAVRDVVWCTPKIASKPLRNSTVQNLGVTLLAAQLIGPLCFLDVHISNQHYTLR